MRARSPGRPSSAAPYAKSGWPAGRGQRLYLTITGRNAEVSAEAAEHPAIEIECRGTVQTLMPGMSLRLG